MKILKLVGFLLLSVPVLAADDLEENSNYVVIGAFASQENAAQFVITAKKASFDARFEMNPNRQLFYVYVLHTGNKQIAIEEAQKLRKKTIFWDTWVFSGFLGANRSASVNASDYHPETGEKLTRITADDNQVTPSIAPLKAKADEIKEIEPISPITEATKPESPTTTVVYPKTEEADADSRHFVFKIFASSENKTLEGEVDIIDLEKKKKVSSFKGNKDVLVRAVNKSGDVSAECEVFGYRKVKHIINVKQPQATEGVVIENDQAIIPFELVRLKKGDYAVMYNVFFYKDAAIMRPESRYEVDALTEMMKENPKYKIRIHGHTNGNAAGKIIASNDPKNFFSLSNTKDSFGSAKKLSEERSIIIQNYLISEGIDPGRLQVKAWGGKKPVYEKDHSLAHSNVRVEIEIVEE